jgi:hypothetical protein
VLVTGEPGMGKTALSNQLSEYATSHGGRVLVGHCYEEGFLWQALGQLAGRTRGAGARSISTDHLALLDGDIDLAARLALGYVARAQEAGRFGGGPTCARERRGRSCRCCSSAGPLTRWQRPTDSVRSLSRS